MLRRSLLIAIAATACSGTVLADMTTMEALQSGKVAGSRANVQAIKGSISGTKGGEVINGYNESPPPQSSYWGGSGSSLNTMLQGGAGKITECDTTGLNSPNAKDKQHCEAVNAIARQPNIKPTGLIERTDPMMIKGNAIAADPASIAGAIDGNYSNCTTTTKKNDPAFTMETCDDWSQTEEASCRLGMEVVVDPDYLYSCMETLKIVQAGTCTVGTVVNVDADYNYQCQQSPKKITNQTCDKTLVVTPVNTPGCTPGQFLVRVIADPCPWCYDYLVWDYYCQAGYYQQHFYSNWHGGGLYYDYGWANIAGTPGTYIPQTQGLSNMGGGWCYITYYSQSCSGSTCSMGTWFSNPCQGTSYYGANTFTMPTKLSFIDTWNDQCTTLAARAQ